MSITINGTVAPGYEPVADAFAANFDKHGDIEAASKLVEAPPPDLRGLTPDQLPEQFRSLLEVALDPNSLFNGTDTVGQLDYNSPRLHRAELPASNGIGTARSLARMYAALIGEADGVRLLNDDTVTAAIQQQTHGLDRVTRLPMRWGTGYQLPTPPYLPCGGPASFGHPGRGGSLAFADLSQNLAFAYVMNYGINGSPDTRATDLVAALG
ncbi:serine hydrolase [Nocardia sp. NPDC020380]|uniref:serine hydrolase n=1 Tax=Nocardia sp. NPDC020380 TaxID=3364309 RepID=UPI0037934250